MSKRIFTKDQIAKLLKNDNVENCSEKYITYSDKFKKTAFQLYEQGMTHKDIFRQAGFDLDVIGQNTPKECMNRWRRASFATKKKGRPKKEYLTDEEKMKWLEAENAYLRAENDFLAKLRAGKAE